MKKTVVIDGVEYLAKSECDKIKKTENCASDNPFMEIGKSYFIRTVTHYFTGRLIWVGDKEIVLEDAAWIADTGRFHQFVAGTSVNEVEPFPKGSQVVVGRGSIVDMTEHGILLEVK